MRLSILDQSPIISGHDAPRAIAETLALARRADELGYYRYWLAEHHAIAALGDPCPEVLVARLGAETRRLRIGTGGVLLPYYSAFRVAESFRMLEALYPGRIDLGVGRAPGGDARTAQAVAGGGFPDARHFPEQVWQLTAHLDGTLPADHPYKPVRVQPEVPTTPEVWLLGSSDYSGALAAQLGLPFSFAHFINPRGGDEVTRAYRQSFRAGREAKPRAMYAPSLFAHRRMRRQSASPRRSTFAGCTWRSTSIRRSRLTMKPRATAMARRSTATSWGNVRAPSSAHPRPAARRSKRWRAAMKPTK
jgi:luciferase family oxidoreductase group 1